MTVWMLKISLNGERDDIFLYENEKDAKEKCYSYFEKAVCNLNLITKSELYDMTFKELNRIVLWNYVGSWEIDEQDVL